MRDKHQSSFKGEGGGKDYRMGRGEGNKNRNRNENRNLHPNQNRNREKTNKQNKIRAHAREVAVAEEVEEAFGGGGYRNIFCFPFCLPCVKGGAERE